MTMPAQHHNHLGQPIGFPLPDWRPPPRPQRTPMQGRYCRVEPLEPERHARDLHAANALDAEGRNWTYLGSGPFDEFDAYLQWMKASCRSEDPLFHAIIDLETGKGAGVAAYMRIDTRNGSVE